MDKNDPLLLTYRTCCIKESDIDCLQEYRYLNDLIISFYFTLLSERFPMEEVVLIEPAVSFSIMIEDDLSIIKECIFDPLEIDKKRFVFVPINDNEKIQYKTSGTHWGLGLIDVEKRIYYYFDSMLNKMNTAIRSMKKFEKLFGKKLHFAYSLEEHFQSNSYDCGMFVLAFTECLLGYIKEHLKERNIFDEVNFDHLMQSNERIKSNLKGFRKEIKDEIYKLIESKKKNKK